MAIGVWGLFVRSADGEADGPAIGRGATADFAEGADEEDVGNNNWHRSPLIKTAT